MVSPMLIKGIVRNNNNNNTYYMLIIMSVQLYTVHCAPVQCALYTYDISTYAISFGDIFFFV